LTVNFILTPLSLSGRIDLTYNSNRGSVFNCHLLTITGLSKTFTETLSTSADTLAGLNQRTEERLG
jgi:hypothetical protein